MKKARLSMPGRWLNHGDGGGEWGKENGERGRGLPRRFPTPHSLSDGGRTQLSIGLLGGHVIWRSRIPLRLDNLIEIREQLFERRAQIKDGRSARLFHQLFFFHSVRVNRGQNLFISNHSFSKAASCDLRREKRWRAVSQDDALLLTFWGSGVNSGSGSRQNWNL